MVPKITTLPYTPPCLNPSTPGIYPGKPQTWQTQCPLNTARNQRNWPGSSNPTGKSLGHLRLPPFLMGLLPLPLFPNLLHTFLLALSPHTSWRVRGEQWRFSHLPQLASPTVLLPKAHSPCWIFSYFLKGISVQLSPPLLYSISFSLSLGFAHHLSICCYLPSSPSHLHLFLPLQRLPTLCSPLQLLTLSLSGLLWLACHPYEELWRRQIQEFTWSLSTLHLTSQQHSTRQLPSPQWMLLLLPLLDGAHLFTKATGLSPGAQSHPSTFAPSTGNWHEVLPCKCPIRFGPWWPL